MNRQAIFHSPEQALTVTFNMLMRLGIIVSWSLFGAMHLAVAILALWVVWLLGVTPAQAAAALQQALTAWPLAALSTAGASVLGLIALYWRAAKALHVKTAGGWLIEYLLQDARER